MYIQGGPKLGLYSYTLEEGVWKSLQRFYTRKQNKAKHEKKNNAIYSLTETLIALPLTLVSVL